MKTNTLYMKRILLSIAIIMTAVSCSVNPFFTSWETPYGIPDFTQVKEKHYVPAVIVGIAQQTAEIEEIINNPDEPTFENVVEAYERSGAILDRVVGVLFNLSETDGTESLQAIVENVLPLMSAHSDNVFMNPAFFAKVEVLYKNMENLGLNREQEMTLKKLYNSFVQNGIALGEAEQARMREINMELSSLSNTFGNRLLAENNAFAEEFGVTISEYGGAMASTDDRALREKMFKAYASRGNNGNENDTKDLIMKMMALRIEKANLLGYKNPAQMILADKMAGNPEAVDTFLAGIMAPAVEKAKEEIADMQVVMNEDIKAGLLPEGSVIEPWDWAYYTEKVRKAKYALDEEQTKPYFKMENVRQGVFDLTTKLFGLNYEKLEGIPVYHEDVEGFKVTDADGSLIGVILTDYFPRSTKRGGAWMNNFVNQEIVDGVETIIWEPTDAQYKKYVDSESVIDNETERTVKEDIDGLSNNIEEINDNLGSLEENLESILQLNDAIYIKEITTPANYLDNKRIWYDATEQVIKIDDEQGYIVSDFIPVEQEVIYSNYCNTNSCNPRQVTGVFFWGGGFFVIAPGLLTA